MKFDNLLTEVNGFGWFQFRMIILMITARATLPFHYLLQNFIAVTPTHHCRVSDQNDSSDLRNLTQRERLFVSVPVQEDGTPSSCQMFAEPQYQLLLNSSNFTHLPTVSCRNGWEYDHTNFKSTLVTEWDLVCDDRTLNRATAVIFFLGVMMGAAVFGYLSDRFGRRKTLLLAYLTATTFGLSSAFSYTFVLFAITRFLTGVGLSGISIITFVLCIEWVDIKHRTAMAILLSLDWSAFNALLAAVAYGVRDWRYLTAILTSPLFLAIIGWWWLPESARWLISTGKIDSAHFYLSKCAEINGRKKFMDDLNTEVLSNIVLVENENRKYSFLDLVRTPRMRRLSQLTGIVWFGVACTYYGIGLNITGFGVNIYLTQFIYGVIEIPAKLFILFSLNRVGRRWNEAGALILTGLCIFSSMLIPREMGAYRTAVGALGKMFSEAAFTAIYLFTSELYPTVMRQNGLGYCSFLARVGVSVSPLILLLEDVWIHLPNVVFSIVAFVAALCAFFLPETLNTRLPETLEDVEQRRRSISTADEKSQA